MDPKPDSSPEDTGEATPPAEPTVDSPPQGETEKFSDETEDMMKPGAEDTPPAQRTLKDPPPPAGATAPAEDEPAAKHEPTAGNEADDVKPPAVEPKEVANTGVAHDEEEGKPAKEEDAPKEEAEGGEKKAEKKKREINPKFKDVQETGAWGGISTAEKAIVGFLALAVVVVLVVVLVIFLPKDKEPTEELVAATTQVPTPLVTSMPPEEKINLILDDLRTNPITATLADTLSADAASYDGMVDDQLGCSEDDHACAMAWVLYSDDFPPVTNNVRDRFALAAIYFALDGNNWLNRTNWLTSTSYCTWHGITCNRLATIVEDIDLGENGLKGEIPLELSLIDTLGVISMNNNQLSGPLPGDVISSLPQLFVLYVQDNMLTGPIPDNLLNEDESLAHLYIQGNSFTGTFPEIYCSQSGGPVFKQFSLDCSSRNECPEGCCESENCF